MKKTILIALMILLTPIASAQITESFEENFDDDLVGNTQDAVNPNEEWYEYDPVLDLGNCFTAATISTTGAISGKSLRYDPTASDQCLLRIRITETDGTPIKETGFSDRPLSAAIDWDLNLVTGAVKMFEFSITIRESDTLSTVVRMGYSNGNLCAKISGTSYTEAACAADAFETGILSTSLIRWRITFNHLTEEITIRETVSDSTVTFAFPFKINYVSVIGFLDDGSDSAGGLTADREVIIDNFKITVEPTAAGNPVQAAKSFFANAWGLADEAVGWLFSLFIIGATVTGVGRGTGNTLATAIAGFIAEAACVFLQLLPFWILLVTIFLIIAVAGNKLFGGERQEGDD